VLAPAAVMGATTGLEFLHPLALSVLGGLVTTLYLALFVLPSVYLRLADRQLDEPKEGRRDADAVDRPGIGDQPGRPRDRDRETAPI